jgi:hypothetical protein
MLQSNILLNVTNQNSLVPGDSHEDNTVVAHACSDEIVSLVCGGHEQSELCDRSQVLLRTVHNNAEVGVLNLPWETIPTNDFVTRLSPDVILAAGLFTIHCGSWA